MAGSKKDVILGEDLSSYYKGSEPQEHAPRTASEEAYREKYNALVKKQVEQLQTASNQEVRRVLNQLANDKNVRKEVGDGLIHKLEADIMRQLEQIRKTKKP